MASEKKVLDNIFSEWMPLAQPFFITKPTGQGTGLGLSLSCDIVKAHDGELSVKTKEGEGSTFIILLPIKLTHAKLSLNFLSINQKADLPAIG